ncbi:hypothetical protein PHSY_001670 [Pseudozyma hubeiensis SY62]|uniref:Uncharacterized protein n=1 Tax=Pseudozyma hubeiensis (strain SY62) TaxID=1305764 RepID=R9NZB7_PSEHS|nr:hypothetical protein PHSY_001670 [Pseudozyma hubeiensis SY62]GAC94101.1 hypothetical protein PHSY_001670 [Pseudozyma hubeiensis SY62]
MLLHVGTKQMAALEVCRAALWRGKNEQALTTLNDCLELKPTGTERGIRRPSWAFFPDPNFSCPAISKPRVHHQTMARHATLAQVASQTAPKHRGVSMAPVIVQRVQEGSRELTEPLFDRLEPLFHNRFDSPIKSP